MMRDIKVSQLLLSTATARQQGRYQHFFLSDVFFYILVTPPQSGSLKFSLTTVPHELVAGSPHGQYFQSVILYTVFSVWLLLLYGEIKLTN